MNVSPISKWSNSFVAQANSQADYSKSFSKALDNFKHGRPVDYDEDKMKGQKTQTMTQVLSDGSTLMTVFDEKGRVISQRKTAAVIHDPNLHVIGTHVESNFDLGELEMQGNINLASIQ